MKLGMHVLIFSDYISPYGGNFISMLSFLQKAEPLKTKCVFLFPKQAEKQKWVSELKNVFFLKGNPIIDVFTIIKIIKHYKIDIIHTHFILFKDELILRIARLFSRKTISLRHMHMIYHSKKNPLLEWIKRCVSNADLTVACSHPAESALFKNGISPVKTVVNAIDFSRFSSDILKRKQINPKKVEILMFGHNYKLKGIDIAIKALNLLNDPSFILKIVIPVDRELIIKEIEKDFNNLPSFVEILPATEDIASYYYNADIFLSSSRSESFCYALREAGFCGCILVASDIAAHHLKSGEIIFENENSKSLSFALTGAKEILFSDNREYIKKQREKIAKLHSINVWTEQIIKIYYDLLK